MSGTNQKGADGSRSIKPFVSAGLTHETCSLGKGSSVFYACDVLDCLDVTTVSRLDVQLSSRATPEPEHWAMLLAGLGITAWIERRCQQTSCRQRVGA